MYVYVQCLYINKYRQRRTMDHGFLCFGGWTMWRFLPRKLCKSEAPTCQPNESTCGYTWYIKTFSGNTKSGKGNWQLSIAWRILPHINMFRVWSCWPSSKWLSFIFRPKGPDFHVSLRKPNHSTGYPLGWSISKWDDPATKKGFKKPSDGPQSQWPVQYLHPTRRNAQCECEFLMASLPLFWPSNSGICCVFKQLDLGVPNFWANPCVAILLPKKGCSLATSKRATFLGSRVPE